MKKGKNHTEVGVPNSTIKWNEPSIYAATWMNLKIVMQKKEARHKRVQTV